MCMDEFIKLCKEMRDAQKAFFKSRLPGDVARAKDFEKRLDKAIEEGVTFDISAPDEPTEKQIGLFEPDAADLLDTFAE